MALTLAIGTQFPDLVDKPLAWYVGILPNGRSLAHSAVVGVVLIGGLLFILSRLRGYDYGVAFSVGHLSHLASDAVYPAFNGRLHELGFLLWPLVPPVEYSIEPSFIAHLNELEFGLTFWFEFGLMLTGVLLFIYGRSVPVSELRGEKG